MLNYKYLPQLPETEASARSVEALILQDKTLAGFENPILKNNPDNAECVENRLVRIEDNPQNFSGYSRVSDGEVVAFMAGAEWLYGDEAPFIKNPLARTAMVLAAKRRGNSLKPKAYGVHGLVAAETLEPSDRDEILEKLLMSSLGRAAAQSAALVNIVIHDRDPLLPIAQDNGFRPVGPLGHAAGAEGILQQRYQRPVDL